MRTKTHQYALWKLMLDGGFEYPDSSPTGSLLAMPEGLLMMPEGLFTVPDNTEEALMTDGELVGSGGQLIRVPVVTPM